MLDSLITSPFLWLTLTIGIFLFASSLYEKWSIPLFNPLIFTILMMILLLILGDISYETYQSGGKLIALFVKPATVALAIILEKNFIYLKKYYRAIFIGITSGVILHTLMIVGFGLFFKLDGRMVATLIPKSITIAIAVSVSESLDGIVSLTVAIVVLTGIIGTILAPLIFKIAKIKNPVAQGVALGSSSHALGTAKAIELGEVQGAMSALSIIVTGIVMVVLVPFTQFFIGYFF